MTVLTKLAEHATELAIAKAAMSGATVIPPTTNSELEAAVTGAAQAIIDVHKAEMADVDGSSLSGYSEYGVGAVAMSVKEALRAKPVSLFGFLSPAKRLTLLAGTQTDVTVELQAAIDSFPSHGTVEIFGNMKITNTIYLKRNGVRVIGRGVGNTFVEYVNAAGGTAFAGAVSNMATITECELSGFAITGSSAGTSASIGVDYTTFSYSIFELSIQTRRVNGVCFDGVGNNGSSPYYNQIKGYLFGGADMTQTGIRFGQGAWAGGSSGPNANFIGPFYRTASLAKMVDLQAGNGNEFTNISGESVADVYFALNNNAPVTTGISTGSGNQVSLVNTGAAWTVNAYSNYAVKISGGTGVGQVRRIKSNTSTTLTLDNPWAVRPDATSTYAIYKNAAHSNKFVNCRAEGLNTQNPDFISAYPGTYGNTFLNSTVESLGAGLTVRDDSGCPSNQWFDGHKVIFTEQIINPGPSFNLDVYARSSVFGGKMLTNYSLEWMSVCVNAAAPGGAVTVKLDAGGTAAGNGDMTMTCVVPNADIGFVMPGPTEKIKRDGTNRHLFLNVATDASFNATADISITWCVSIDL